jgi:NAD(P)-dependent dehydrogenase (short-subunit alcohol dehydrogenase family)
MDMSGRVALVTGGSGHIGGAMAETLAELGAGIVILDLDADRCEETAAVLRREYNVPAIACATNLADSDAVSRVGEFVREKMGRLDVVVNSAALVGSTALPGWATAFEEQSLSTWRAAIEVNVTAVFALTQTCLGLLRESGHGSIVNVASIYGVVGPDWRLYEGTSMGNPAAYAASKGALLQLTRWLSTTLAPAIRVNAITPGGVLRNTQEPFLGRYVSRVPLQRMAREDDFKGATAYLASDLSAYVTGQNIIVDGGWTAW